MSTPHSSQDLIAARQDLRSGRKAAEALLEAALAAAHSPANTHAYVQPPDPDAARAQLAAWRRRPDEALAHAPLAGLAVSIKDMFDVTGETTTAGSRVLGPEGVARPPALADAPAVARLRAAGALLAGRTQMSEFAFSGVGVNPHHGTPANPADPATPRVPGGSSSGGAVTVATGAAWAALGSDTGGSIRIPAALCGIVGFKATARLVPTTGAFPLSTTLDTVSAMTRSVRDAVLLHEVLAARTVVRGGGDLRACRLAVPRQLMQDSMDSTVARAFERALGRLSAAGARIETLDLPELAQAPQLQAHCTFAGAEAAAWHRDWVAPHARLYDPRVLLRLQKGATMLAQDYVDLVAQRQAWIARMERAIGPFDALLSPTVPIVAPPLAEVAPGAERDEAFFTLNGLLLRNTTAINLLDGCALSLPCQQADELPVGLMVWQGAMRDDGVLHASLLIEAALAAGGRA